MSNHVTDRFRNIKARFKAKNFKHFARLYFYVQNSEWMT